MNLLGVVASQNRALDLKIVYRSRIKAEAFGHPFIMLALVLQFFGSGKVHWGVTIISTVGAGRVTRCVGSRWGCLGGRWVGIVAATTEGSIGWDAIVEFHA
jgi:hypothetical protein